jgi:anti-sigma B factor antagonist
VDPRLCGYQGGTHRGGAHRDCSRAGDGGAPLEERSASKPTPDAGLTQAEVSSCFEAAATLITLSGEIDLATSAELESAAQEAIARGQPVRVDVSALSFMDSAGVSFMATLARAGSQAGWRPTFIGPSRRIRELLSMVGLAQAVELE